MTMNEDDRWEDLVSLDYEFLKGGVVLSEWCSFIVRETDLAFTKGAHLATILTAVSGIETYLRSEYALKEKVTFFELINKSPLDSELKSDLHKLRQYRNKWVHVNEPWDDEHLLKNPNESELELMAFFAAKVLRRTIYDSPWL